MEAVTRDGGALKYVPKTVLSEHPDLCLEAVKQNPSSIRIVPIEYITGPLCLEAVTRHGGALNYIPLQYVPDEYKPMLYMAAVKQNGAALQYVPNQEITPKILQEAKKHKYVKIPPHIIASVSDRANLNVSGVHENLNKLTNLPEGVFGSKPTMENHINAFVGGRKSRKRRSRKKTKRKRTKRY